MLRTNWQNLTTIHSGGSGHTPSRFMLQTLGLVLALWASLSNLACNLSLALADFSFPLQNKFEIPGHGN